MNKGSSIKSVNISVLSDETKIRLNGVNEVKNYFNYES